MQQKAFWLAEKWVLSNYRVFQNSKAMWEKYNVIGHFPLIGYGGEYEPQSGFGWTNGVVLDLLSTYSDRLHFVGLESNPDQVAKEIIQREQPKLKSLRSDLNNTLYDMEKDINLTLPLSQNSPKTTAFTILNICICFISWYLFK